jgi:acyl-coenzyme A thioesterase PaaI-like protein
MSVHDQWIDRMKSFQGDLTLPPPSLQELQLEYLEVLPGKKMVAKLPFQQRFTNPVGFYQGGFMAAAIDEVFGPLSYATHNGPCMTISLNLTFIKPFGPQMNFCLIEAMVLKETANFIFMRAEVKSSKGEILSHAETHVNKVKK